VAAWNTQPVSAALVVELRRMTVKPGWARKRQRPLRRNTRKPPWALTPEEQRALAITFVGGLGAIVAGAVVIGVALSLARLAERSHLTPWVWLGLALLTLLMIALAGWLLRGHPFPVATMDFGVAVVAPLVAVLLLLVWIGVAAGVK
jgi:hypothetical protein